MGITVKGVYEKGIVYLTEPLPESLAQREGEEVEVSFATDIDFISDIDDDQALIAALEEIRQEIEALGSPADDTPEERARRVELLMTGLQMGPPMSPEVEASLIESSRRPMSMFTLEGEERQ